jgi:hypothetical protein
MSFIPKFFPDLGKSCSDFFKAKNWHDKQTIEIETARKDPDHKITATFDVEDNVSIQFKEKFNLDKYGTCEAVLKTSGQQSVTLENKDGLVDGVTTSIKGSTDLKTEVKMKYARDSAAVHALIKRGTKGDVSLEPSVVLGWEGLSIGATAKLEPTSEETTLTDYNVGLQVEKGDTTFTVKTEESAENVKAQFSHKLDSRTSVHMDFGYHLSKDKRSASIGGSYAISDDMKFRAKVLSTGIVYGVFTHTLSPQASLLFSAQVNARSMKSDTQKLGVKLSLGDI